MASPVQPALEASHIVGKLSTERLGPYVRACRGDEAQALNLYRWNATASAAMHICLGHVEVLMRNAMDAQLTAMSPLGAWYITLSPRLNTYAREEISTARGRATKNGQPETQGRVIAELTFGFWRYLVMPRYDRVLWAPGLRHAFPGVAIGEASTTLSRLLEMRNRIAHLEPIHNRDLSAVHADACRVARWVDGPAAGWIEQHCVLSRVIDSAPPEATLGRTAVEPG